MTRVPQVWEAYINSLSSKVKAGYSSLINSDNYNYYRSSYKITDLSVGVGAKTAPRRPHCPSALQVGPDKDDNILGPGNSFNSNAIKPIRVLGLYGNDITQLGWIFKALKSLHIFCQQWKQIHTQKLKTSKEFGSCLRDLNAAILLSLIHANGDSILQRISAVSWQLPGHENDAAETIHFQRGSVDIVTFKGPKLGKIESLWIGLESGSWRLDGVALTVINSPQSLSSSPEGMKEQTIDVMQYKFEANNVLLGEGEISVVELRPVLVTESPTATFSTLTNTNPCLSTSMKSGELMNEESMREYSDLKFSLLLYDFILFFTGSSILLTFSSDERYAYTFFVGGIGGFFYLFLLQRSVDGLSTDGELQNFAQGFGRFKGPLFGLALILAASIVAVKNEIGGSTMALTPAELFVGAAGFLTCKIAVVLAAFKPIKISLKEEE